MRSTTSIALAASALLATAGVAKAQVPSPTRGTVVSVTGDDAVIRTPAGRMTAHIAATTRFAGARKASLADIQSNSYIGTAATPAADGTLRALEVTIFPEAMRGIGDGHRPYDLGKSGSMTNGAVTSMTNGTVSAAAAQSSMTNGTVGAMNGRTIKVAYKGGEQTVSLPANIPVVMLEPGNRSLLQTGAKVVAFGPVSGDTIDVKQIVVGEDGVKPPM